MTRFFPAAIILLLLFSLKLLGQNTNTERILSFNSSIVINKDASMIVTENIIVHSEGEQIKRGIYRDFPTRYKDRYGNNIVINFDVIEVLRDGSSEQFHTEELSNGTRVYIGSVNRFLDPGNYKYTIAYKTARQIGFFEAYDELYWNVTGNGWEFIIEKSSVTIHFPENISSDDLKADGFTGYQGSVDRNFRIIEKKMNKISLATTTEILPKQGFTIAVMFPKNIFQEPTTETKVITFVQDNLIVIVSLVGLIILFIYYIAVWFGYGVDPKKGIIIPLYEPPDNLSPAAVRFISEMGFDNKNFSVAVINLAIKGMLKIEEVDGNFTLQRLEFAKSNLTSDEQKLLNKFDSLNDMDTNWKLDLKQKNHAILRNSINELKKSLKYSYEKEYFVTNRKYFIIGIIISIVTIAITILLGTADQSLSLLWLTIWSLGVVMLLFAVFRSWRGAIQNGRIKFTSIGGAIFITLFSIPFIIGEIVGFYFLSDFASPLLTIIVGMIVLCNIVFYHFLKSPTHLGRKLMDKIEGFKMYLSTAEQDMVELFKSPEKTPQLFEKFLPYAIALNVENNWANKFNDIIKSSASEGAVYTPSWYTGATLTTLGAVGLSSSLSVNFSSTISSSSTAPGSSSGIGGSGSSGGGGGGGGGGGW